ncbi:DNA polymerase III subunit delta, partial [bacterium]|nr:DNA polymerase III subunit delta [bacterium]
MSINSTGAQKESALKIIETGKVTFSPLYILDGGDLYLKDSILEIIKNYVLDPSFADFNYTKLECSSSTKSVELRDALRELPMLTDKRLLELRNPEKLTASVSKQIIDDIQETINIGENVICLVYGDSIKEEKAGLKKSLSRFALTINCSVYPNDIPRWINIFCQKKGCSIQRNAVNELQERCGLDIMQLSSQLDKLSHYVRDGQITLQDVKIAVNKSFDV